MPYEIVKVTPVSEEEVARAAAAGGPFVLPGESLLGQASRIRARRPTPRHSEFVATVSRYGERIVLPRNVAYYLGACVRAGLPWAVAANNYWSGRPVTEEGTAY